MTDQFTAEIPVLDEAQTKIIDAAKLLTEGFEVPHPSHKGVIDSARQQLVRLGGNSQEARLEAYNVLKAHFPAIMGAGRVGQF